MAISISLAKPGTTPLLLGTLYALSTLEKLEYITNIDFYRDAGSRESTAAVLSLDAVIETDQNLTRLIEEQLDHAEALDFSVGENFVLTVFSDQGLTVKALLSLIKFALGQGLVISRVNQLSPRDSPILALELKLIAPHHFDMASFRQDLFSLSTEHKIDVGIQKDDVFRIHKRLVVFDMDSTLIKQECIDELAREYGVYDKIAPITESAM